MGRWGAACLGGYVGRLHICIQHPVRSSRCGRGSGSDRISLCETLWRECSRGRRHVCEPRAASPHVESVAWEPPGPPARTTCSDADVRTEAAKKQRASHTACVLCFCPANQARDDGDQVRAGNISVAARAYSRLRLPLPSAPTAGVPVRRAGSLECATAGVCRLITAQLDQRT